jgi:hypothetical protein
MKLKPIVASLMLLGLAAPAFAANSSTSAGNQAQLDEMKAQLNKMQAVIDQNSAGHFQQLCDWFNRITLSGMVNVDGTYGNRSPTRQSNGSVSNLAVNNANIFLDAAVNDWTNVHLNLQHRDNLSSSITPPSLANQDTDFDEAYVTIGNFAQSPLYLRAGREYVPFGVYDRYPIVMNPTQLLSETRATAAQVGFVSPMGIYGSAYGFRGLAKTGDATRDQARVQNYGFDLGYGYCADAWGLKLDAGYLRNMNDVNDVAVNRSSYQEQASGLSLHAGVNVQQFDFKGDYVTALQNFNVSDLSRGTTPAKGAKPTAWGLEAGLSFPVANNHTSRLAVGYQRSKDSVAVGTTTAGDSGATIGLPKNRWYGDYVVNVSKWTDVGFELYRDQAYSRSNGGSGSNATVGVVRLGVKFA